MKLELDTHTHTIASGHAYNTMQEMITAAQEKGLQLLGITDHAIAMPGTCHLFYFHNLRVVERNYNNLELMLGSEVNIIDYDGNLDLDNVTLSGLDYAIASLHTPCIDPGNEDENTNALVNAMQNPYIHIIGHPDDSRFPINYERIVLAAKEYHVLLELNNSSLSPKSFRLDARENDIKMLHLCKQHGVSISLGSDAHIADDIGNISYSSELLEYTNFPEELIINTSVNKFKQFIETKSKLHQ
ncbi:MAG TPA: phosphatase [Lachnospiraceae bacterium]|nr:phosphatase [Lachnospiraceae bacterium]